MSPRIRDALATTAGWITGLVVGLAVYMAAWWFGVGAHGGNARGFLGMSAAAVIFIVIGAGFYWLRIAVDRRQRRIRKPPLDMEDSDIRTFMRALWSRPQWSQRRPWGRRARPRRRA